MQAALIFHCYSIYFIVLTSNQNALLCIYFFALSFCLLGIDVPISLVFVQYIGFKAVYSWEKSYFG